MRRSVPILLTLALGAAACGSSDGGATTTTTAVTTTTAAATTTTAAPTTTTAAFDPMAAAAAMAGDFTGEWNNTTFGSSGSVDATVVVDLASGSVIATVDLGGNVFGSSDPDPFTTEFDILAANPQPGESMLFEDSNSLLGDYSVQVNADGSMTLIALAVPGHDGWVFEVDGTLAPGAMHFTYKITAGGSPFAEGTVDVAPAP